MGFFDRLTNTVRKGFQSSTNFIKDVGSGVLKGITKGLSTTRQVIDAGKIAVAGLSTLPVLGQALQAFQLPLSVADKVVSNLQDVDTSVHAIGAQYDKGGFSKDLLPKLVDYSKAVTGLVNLIPERK